MRFSTSLLSFSLAAVALGTTIPPIYGPGGGSSLPDTTSAGSSTVPGNGGGAGITVTVFPPATTTCPPPKTTTVTETVTKTATVTQAPGANCPPASEAVPLIRLWNPTISDHFYTTSLAEANSLINGGGYVRERDTGRIFTQQFPGTVPFHRLYDPDITDHYYTSTDPLNLPGYHVETITGYVYPDSSCGGTPLYRMWSGSATDHFYTEAPGDVNNAEHAGQQYTLDHIDGYVLPSQ